MKKIAFAIVITFILAVIIITSLLLIQKNIISDKQNEDAIGDAGEIINYDDNKIENCTDEIKIFSVRNCIQMYLDIINLNSTIYEDGNEKVSQDVITKTIYEMLSKEYIEKNNITQYNLYDNVEVSKQKLIFVPLKIRMLELGKNTKYIVYGFCQKLNNQYLKDLYFIVNVDNENKTYSIEPINNRDNKLIEDIELNKNSMIIDKNQYNMYVEQKITDQYLCEQYLLNYKRFMICKPEESYNYLDEQYRNKRFGSLDNYLEYITQNKRHIEGSALRAYDVKTKGEEKEYICRDQYENYYTFTSKNYFDYKVKLDAYTIETEDIINEYSKYDQEKKVSYNIAKCVQMINNKDYENLYNTLNITFKQNNWASVQEFKEYINKNYPGYYKYEYEDYQKIGENYTQKIKLQNIDKNIQAADKNLNIIMKLKDNRTFEISFKLD